MNYYTFQLPVPSLQQIAETKIVSELLLNVEDIKTELEKCLRPSFNDFVKNLPNVKHKVKEKVAALVLPEPINKNLLSWVNTLSCEVGNWCLYHKIMSLYTVIKIPNNICWTLQGTVDNRKTAELIVKDETVDIETRYTMACVYCLVNEIPILWQRIPQGRQERYYDFEDFRVQRGRYMQSSDLRCLLTFWTYTINGKISELIERVRYSYWPDISADQFPFHCAVAGGNKTAVKFFFEKFSCEGQSLDMPYNVTKLLRGFTSCCQTEVLFFMMSLMNEEQQEKVLKDYVFKVLAYMLRWPYQSFFMETAKKCIGFLRRHEYPSLLRLMCIEIMINENDYNSLELFGEFWQLCSVNCHDFFQNFYVLLILIELFEAKKENLVKYILDQATDSQKNQLIYVKEDDAVDGLILLVYKEKWNFLKFLMDNVSEETIITFQRNVAIELSAEENSSSKAKLNKTFLLVNELMEVRK